MNDKKDNIIVFTTRILNIENSKKNYLFSKGKVEKKILGENSFLAKYHLDNLKKDDVNIHLWEKFNSFGKNKRIKFLEERRKNVNKEGDNHISIDELIDNIEDGKSIKIDFTKQFLYDRTDSPLYFNKDYKIKFEQIFTSEKIPIALALRKFIFKRKELKIFGYRCLDLYDDYVESRRDFLTSLVKDIAIIYFKFKAEEFALKDFFDKYNLVLILHEDDIEYPKDYNKKLNEEEKNSFLFKNNKELKYFSKQIETFVFQHTSNIFVRFLINFPEEISSEQKLIDKLNNYLINRKDFEEKEDALFNSDFAVKNVKVLKEILKKFKDDKIY